MKYFGPFRWGPVAEIEHVSPPEGQLCHYCAEKVTAKDYGFLVPTSSGNEDPEAPYHHECFIRMIVGSAGHIQKRCSCYTNAAPEEDPPGLTKRQAAMLAAGLAGWLHG